MKELIDLRKPREKHFLNSDGTFTVQMYDHDIHYLKNGKYEEIDNRLEETETFIYNKHNSYHAYFFKENLEELMRLEKDSDFLSFSLVRSKACHILTNSKFVIYQNILKNIDIEYKFVRNKIKDSIIINSIDNNFSDFAFVIKTNLDLNLENNTIWILKDGKKINQMEPPTLMDKNKNFYFIQYELEKRESDYILTFSFDKELLNQENLYPFVIDPTLVNNDKKAVYDTYIYAGDEGVNRNDTDILKVGVDENGKIYRTLVKFDLPTIGTGCEVVNAVATLVSHASEFVVQNSQYEHKRFFAHEITSAWDESTASWNNMHDKYNERVEDCFIAYKTEIFGYDYFLKTTSIDVTNLVKRWYAGAANNGLLVKLEEEVKSEHSYYPFYSKNNNISEGNEGADDPKPYLIVTYRNFNGLEDYMTYQEISHQEGSSYVNHLTGNLTNVFEANKTVGGKYPIALNLVYNSNDVVLETDVGLGIGYRFNFLQTIKEVTISDNPYLEYVDGDGTIHYFYKEDDTTYLDEDGLNLKATFASEKWTIQDKSNNQSIFQKSGDTYYLNKLIDSYQNEVVITYDSSNRIQSVTDANNETITISYEENKITTTSNYQTSILNKTNQKIISLVTRQGTTSFAYNSYGLVSKITDTDGLATEFSYYDASPYRMKKITEKGLSGTEGNTLEFIYSFLVTRVMDGKGRCNTYVFNEQGNTINTTSLKNPTDFRNGYGVENIYDSNTNNTKNKLSLNIPTMKYVKNYFIDPSFESKNIGFIYDNAQVTNTNVHSGNKCVVTNYQIQIPLPILETSGYYTFSGYFKNSSSMELSIRTSSSNVTDVQYYYFSDEYKRRIITAYLEAGTQYYLNVFPVNSATIYMDDFQLEEGNVASYLNLVENSDFSNGMSTWESSVFNMTGEDIINDDTIVTLDNGQKAYQMNCKPSLSKILSKQISVKGKKGDAYRLSFWYKNEGLGTGTIASGNIAVLTFGYTSDVPHGTPTYGLNSHATEWQYFERIIVAEEDYESFSLSIMAQFNVNKLYFTNLYLVKDLGGNSFEYDEEGNLISATDTSNSTSIFQYDANNQLVSNFSPKGNSFKFEYDNTDSQKLLQGVSSKGIANQIEYDENQNPINTIIKSVKTLDDFTQEYFYIRKKSTEDYLFADFEGNIPKLRPFECNLSRFLLERVHDEDRNVDYYYIKTDIVERYFAYRDNISEKVVLVENKNDASLFELISNKNGSYTLRIKKVYETDSEELVYDACIAFNDSNALIIENYEIDNPDQELFFESAVTPLYAETKAEYQSNGKFISKTIDALGKVTTYDINPVTGLTTSVKEPNGTVTSYEYNDKEQVTKITKNEKEILYAYNSQNLLDKITSNNKEYKFVYDDFLNQKQVKLGDTVFVTNHYENNNGNLASINYGNNTSVSYTYDDLDRLKTMTKSNHVYTYDYDNLNHLSKVKSTEETYEYLYDFAGRIVEYLYNQTDNFLQKSRVQYEYDINNNVTKKTVNNTLNNFITEYVYDEDDNIIKVTFDNISLNYQRDYLGRLVSKNINDQIPVEYTYYTNGNKTSFVLKSMKIDDELYEYYYDDVYNLSKVFKNEKILYEYYYDEFHELVEEHNYETKKTYRYRYDASGNILSKREFELQTSNLLHEDTYTYGNTNWEDQLTKFNDINITYDEIGNPITIGSATLSYGNGRELQSYQDTNLNVTYKYSKDGIRRKKIVNNVETEYFTENNAILIEKTGSNMLYYIRDDNNNLLGFQYNGVTYYYKKNLQEDIVGIYNQSFELIATYEYDAWGKILNIKDNNGNPITESNHIAIINPYRYRSYYYDNETKFYYLNSRYYNPEWGRFINADKYLFTAENFLELNLYLYALNNPVNNYDNDGNFFKNLFKKITTTVTKVAKKVVEVTKKVVNTVKKTVQKVKASFTAEVGVGVGAGAGVNIGGAGANLLGKKTFNWGYSNGKTYTSTTTAAQASVGIANKDSLKAGISYEVTHYDHDAIAHSNPMIMPWEIKDCEYTSKDISITAVYKEKTTTSFEQDKTFVGIDVDAFLGIGVHFKIGFNI